MDIARALAILGMFIVHAVLVLGREVPRSGWTHGLFWLCDGRAAATFVTLAGLGVGKLSQRMAEAELAKVLRRRALILGLLGVANLGIWEGDILRLYGIALGLAPWLVGRSGRSLMAWAVGLIGLFPILAWRLRWEARWDFATLAYRGLWEPVGFLRNTLFDGFRPAVPWMAFFLLGLVLSRFDLATPARRRRLLLAGAGLLTSALLLSALARPWAISRFGAQVGALLSGTGSMPPLPPFVLSAAGTTCLTLALAHWSVGRLPAFAESALAATGRRALSWYVWHIVLLVALYSAGVRNLLAPGVAMGLGLLGFLLAVGHSYLFRERPGRLEQALRGLSRPRSAAVLPEGGPREGDAL